MATKKDRPDFTHVDDVPLTRLHLDPENARHDPIQDEDKIIAQLYSAEKALAVAKDIASKGTISPLDRIGVIEMDDHPGHYLVVEGNRRTCALKRLATAACTVARPRVGCWICQSTTSPVTFGSSVELAPAARRA